MKRKVSWGKALLFSSIICSVLAHKKLDVPGYTRQFIYRVNNDCKDFKPVQNRCHVWKDMGFCFKYRREMQHVCNRTCQYCVPGQKQWEVINVKGVWGRVHNPTSAHASPATPSRPLVQQARPLVQILGKERPLQTDNAADAIATQLESNNQRNPTPAPINKQASPQILGRLPTIQVSSLNPPPQNKNITENGQLNGLPITSNPVKPVQPQSAETGFSGSPSAQAGGQLGSDKTQVGETSSDRHPVVVLMGYELGDKSSKKVHDVLRYTDTSVQRNSGASLGGTQTESIATNNDLAPSQKSTAYSNAESAAFENIQSEGVQNISKRPVQDGDSAPQEGAGLNELAELLDSAAAMKQHKDIHDESNGSTALWWQPHAVENQSVNDSQGGKIPKARGPQTDVILPISTDLKALVSGQVIANSMHGNSVHGTNSTNTTLGGMRADSVKIEPGNKHGDINDPSLQLNPPLQKAGKQVTLTINERPGTGEAVFKVQNSPHATGLAYTTEGVPGEMPPPNFLLMNENEQARAKAEEEEKRIQEATHSIKSILRLFNEGRSSTQNKPLQQQPQDFPANSKSLDDSPDLTGLQSALDAQSQDNPGARAQALAKQIGQLLNANNPSGGPMQPLEVPNYALVSTGDSQDWKSLARTLATQLKHVLNHMKDRERENTYEKEKMREQMMMLTREGMMGMDDDGDPDEDDDDNDDYRRRHFIFSHKIKKKSKMPAKPINWKRRKTFGMKKRTKMHSLLHGAIKKSSQLEKLHTKKHG